MTKERRICLITKLSIWVSFGQVKLGGDKMSQTSHILPNLEPNVSVSIPEAVEI